MRTPLPILVCLALTGCGSDVGSGKTVTTKMKIRKQVYELTLEDIREHAAWEFALDEEGDEGQDEATVRPVTAAGSVDPGAGMFIVRARFTLADGTPLLGYITPSGDPNDLGTIQPQIITGRGQVGLWMGTIRDDIAPRYERLGKSAAQVFPVSFESDFPIVRGSVKGSIPAFLHLEDLQSRRVKEIK